MTSKTKNAVRLQFIQQHYSFLKTPAQFSPTSTKENLTCVWETSGQSTPTLIVAPPTKHTDVVAERHTQHTRHTYPQWVVETLIWLYSMTLTHYPARINSDFGFTYRQFGVGKPISPYINMVLPHSENQPAHLHTYDRELAKWNPPPGPEITVLNLAATGQIPEHNLPAVTALLQQIDENPLKFRDLHNRTAQLVAWFTEQPINPQIFYTILQNSPVLDQHLFDVLKIIQ